MEMYFFFFFNNFKEPSDSQSYHSIAVIWIQSFHSEESFDSSYVLETQAGNKLDQLIMYNIFNN